MQELIKSSLTEDSFSSNTHSIAEVRDIVIEDDYIIPQRYFVDRVTLLPVNLNKYFIYWEITKELKNRYNLTEDKFVFKIYDNNGNFLADFKGEGEVGDYYLYRSFEEANLQVVMGFIKQDKFIKIMESKKVIPFTDKISFAKEEDNIWLTKIRGKRELVESSINREDGYSSDKFIDEFSKHQMVGSS